PAGSPRRRPLVRRSRAASLNVELLIQVADAYQVTRLDSQHPRNPFRDYDLQVRPFHVRDAARTIGPLATSWFQRNQQHQLAVDLQHRSFERPHFLHNAPPFPFPARMLGVHAGPASSRFNFGLHRVQLRLLAANPVPRGPPSVYQAPDTPLVLTGNTAPLRYNTRESQALTVLGLEPGPVGRTVKYA